MEETSEKINNVYAHDIKNNVVYILNAKSGLQGYYCMGCGKEMQAVRSNILNRKQFFRHHHNAIPGEHKCTYNDETYRHKLAKDILVRLKSIKVPALYKYPPKGEEGNPMFISEPHYINASYASTELYFYEDEDCTINYSETVNFDKNDLLIKPDVIFFDKEMIPFLFIEINATHKIDNRKRAKLKRLGINTIQVTIPQASPEEIEKIFSITKYTKWIYNREYENTDYIRIPEGNAERVQPFDELQRELFEESFECRATQIKNFIRSIERLLESKRFTESRYYLESKILEVEDSTRRVRRNQEKLQIELRKAVEEDFTGRRENLDTEKERFRMEENEFRERKEKWNREQDDEIEQEVNRLEKEFRNGFESKARELEERYNRKRQEIDRKLGEIEEEQERVRDTIGRMEQDYGGDWSTEESFRNSESGIRTKIERANRINEEFQQKINELKKDESEFDSHEFESRKSIEERYRIQTEEIDRETKREFRPIEELERELREEFQNWRESLIEAIKTGDYTKIELTREFKETLSDVGNLDDYKHFGEMQERYSAAKKLFDSGTWKEWVKTR